MAAQSGGNHLSHDGLLHVGSPAGPATASHGKEDRAAPPPPPPSLPRIEKNKKKKRTGAAVGGGDSRVFEVDVQKSRVLPALGDRHGAFDYLILLHLDRVVEVDQGLEGNGARRDQGPEWRVYYQNKGDRGLPGPHLLPVSGGVFGRSGQDQGLVGLGPLLPLIRTGGAGVGVLRLAARENGRPVEFHVEPECKPVERSWEEQESKQSP